MAPTADPVLDPEAARIRLLFWNLRRPMGIHRGLVNLVHQLQPDVAACVEPGPNAAKNAAAYEAVLPGYSVEFLPRGILWISRLDYRLVKRGKLEEAGAFARLEVSLGQRRIEMLVADVTPHAFRSRRGQLAQALRDAGSHRDAILMGDLNTPAESVFLDAYRARFVSAFEAAGSGLRETWPMGMPLLNLDYVWVGRGWGIEECQKIARPADSDHCALFVRLRRLRSDESDLSGDSRVPTTAGSTQH